MSPLIIVVSAFMVALVVMSLTFFGGAVPVALPLAALVIGFSVWLDLRRRRQQTNTLADERRHAKAHSVEFTDRDKQTLYSD